MFETLKENFYPEERTVKQQILQHRSIFDNRIKTWKTRAKIRIRTERRMLSKIMERRIQRILIWQNKQSKFFYRLKGFARFIYLYLSTTLSYTFVQELFTFFFKKRKSCTFRRLKKKQLKFNKYIY